jgi:pimeloyl-ACP methyl ester carboxylesterase
MTNLAQTFVPRRSAGRVVELREVPIPPNGVGGMLRIPNAATSLVAFAHGNGLGRHSQRSRVVAEALNRQNIATLLLDLLTPDEKADRANVFDIPLLAERLVHAVRRLDREPGVAGLPLGLYSASTGAAAAIVAAVELGDRVGAVVLRGGRPDLAGGALDRMRIPTLLIAGGADLPIIALNQKALARLRGPKALEIVPGASHLFPERGAMDAVIGHTARWFERHLTSRAPGRVHETQAI